MKSRMFKLLLCFIPLLVLTSCNEDTGYINNYSNYNIELKNVTKKEDVSFKKVYTYSIDNFGDRVIDLDRSYIKEKDKEVKYYPTLNDEYRNFIFSNEKQDITFEVVTSKDYELKFDNFNFQAYKVDEIKNLEVNSFIPGDVARHQYVLQTKENIYNGEIIGSIYLYLTVKNYDNRLINIKGYLQNKNEMHLYYSGKDKLNVVSIEKCLLSKNDKQNNTFNEFAINFTIALIIIIVAILIIVGIVYLKSKQLKRRNKKARPE